MDEILKIRAPVFPESISEGSISEIYKKSGECISEGDLIAEIETDKIVLEVPVTKTGIIKDIFISVGNIIKSNDIIANILVQENAKEKFKEQVTENMKESIEKINIKKSESIIQKKILPQKINVNNETIINANLDLSPSQRRMFQDPTITYNKQDNINKNHIISNKERKEKRIKISRLRQTIAKRLLDSQNNSAIVTTFNEVDMSHVIDIRLNFKEIFSKAHDVKLGFMSFFIKASLIALQKFPNVNAFLDQQEIIYHDYVDIGIAVGSDNGLVVPIIRDIQNKSFAEIEKDIIDKATKVKQGTLSISDMQGGTFTITNGGIYGSMLSTPIINPPQCAILGMHNIVKRAVVDKNNNIIVKPIMYLALSYDHRLIDGSTSVKFLNTIKNNIENPNRMLLLI